MATITMQDVILCMEMARIETREDRKNFINRWIAELGWYIQTIERDIALQGYAWFLGERQFSRDYRRAVADREFLKDNKAALISVTE